MALKAYALTSLARLKTWADISTADDDTLLTDIINAVTSWIESYCGRRFKQTTYTEQEIDSDGSEVLFLPEYPVDETTDITLEIRTSALREDDWDEIDSEDYFVDWDEGMIKIAGGGKWIKGRKKYRATYKAGYDFDPAGTTFLTDTGAGDLEIAIWKLCTALYEERRSGARIAAERLGDYSVRFARIAFEDDPTIGAVLDRYRKLDETLGVMGPDLY